jgi:hypothetical protein
MILCYVNDQLQWTWCWQEVGYKNKNKMHYIPTNLLMYQNLHLLCALLPACLTHQLIILLTPPKIKKLINLEYLNMTVITKHLHVWQSVIGKYALWFLQSMPCLVFVYIWWGFPVRKLEMNYYEHYHRNYNDYATHNKTITLQIYTDITRQQTYHARFLGVLNYFPIGYLMML